KAPVDKVMKLWQGLGYYSRARNLHEAAKCVVKDFGGKFPGDFEGLKKLKGVGEYSASAISSICYNEPRAVVDGNVYRVLSRVFGLKHPIDSTKGKKVFRELADELLYRKDPGNYNQAIMEFGAKYCVPKNPDCANCIFFLECVARKKKLVEQLPVKEKKTKVRERHLNYLLIHHKDGFYIKERKEKDIWKGLYDLPLIETKKKISAEKLIAGKEWKNIFGNGKTEVKKVSTEVKHLLSHQHLFVRFIRVKVSVKVKEEENWKYVTKKELKKFGMPIVIHRYLETVF
ncbi:MAG TPA: NUDIX domain-containing protein, partial [Bacteroidia bacterium]|nr:NUDIX domain-containing protein [Bacteroidia bacterium]